MAMDDDSVSSPPAKRPRTPSSVDCAPAESPAELVVRRVSSDVLQEWGLPRGVKLTFDPSDEELLWHLLAKAGNRQIEPHPLISEFIISVDEDDRFGYTHPQRLEGVKQDGSVSYFFHRRFKVSRPGQQNPLEVQNDDFGAVWWHKIGMTAPVIIDGTHYGCKKIMVLYETLRKGGKPEKTNWVMYQYHLGSGEEGEGEFVASKIFYYHKSGQSNTNAQDQISKNASAQAAVNHYGEEILTHAENGEFYKCDTHCKEDSPRWAEAERSQSCISDNGLIGMRTVVKDSGECQTGDTSNQYINLGSLDYSAEFTTDQIFKSKEDIIKWTREIGRLNGFVIVIKKSELGGSGRKPRLTFWCDRGGKYRDHRRLISKNSGTDNEETEKPIKRIGSKKCECPFSLIGKKLATEDDWMLVVSCGLHNHSPDEELLGNPSAGRLTAEETSLLVDMFNSSARPKDILTTLKQRDPLNNGVTIKTIYNARQKYRKAGKIIDRTSTFETKVAEQERINI